MRTLLCLLCLVASAWGESAARKGADDSRLPQEAREAFRARDEMQAAQRAVLASGRRTANAEQAKSDPLQVRAQEAIAEWHRAQRAALAAFFKTADLTPLPVPERADRDATVRLNGFMERLAEARKGDGDLFAGFGLNEPQMAGELYGRLKPGTWISKLCPGADRQPAESSGRQGKPAHSHAK